MQKAKEYMFLKGWKEDLEQTLTDFQDLATIVKRNLKPSDKKFDNLTSREMEAMVENANSLIFYGERDFLQYAMTNKWPLGPCIIYEGRNKRKFDDSFMFN